MRCDLAEELVSSAIDAPLSDDEAGTLLEHQQSCGACRAFAEQMAVVRQRLRIQPVDDVPDVTGAVRDRLAAHQHRQRLTAIATTDWLRVAAVFIAAFLVAAVVVGQLAPAPVLAENLGERILAAQSDVSAMSADVRVVERGWHPAVPERTYSGTLNYQNPESLRLRLDDRTAYPSPAWPPNNTEWFVDEDTASSTGLRPCPTTMQPSCSGSGARAQAWHGRAPFDADVPAPLDIVVPVASFALTTPAGGLGIRTIDGVDALGVRVTAAQAAPLLDGILRVGNWREIHHADIAEVWLETSSLTPVLIELLPAHTPERRLWAATRHLTDPSGEWFLRIALRNVRLNHESEPFRRPAPPSDGTADAGFVADPAFAGTVRPAWLPEGATQHRSGRRGDVAIASWTDGRAWLRIESTRSWQGNRLFGAIGEIVRPIQLGAGTGYTDATGTAIAIHAAGFDVAVRGSYDADTMQRIAASIPAVGRVVPAGWVESDATTVAQAADVIPGLLMPHGLEGFVEPAVRVVRTRVAMRYVGAGARGFILTQAPGGVLSPPFDADVVGVVVRGHQGRFTSSRGVLEWVEDGRVVALESDSLGLSELVTIADALRPQQ